MKLCYRFNVYFFFYLAYYNLLLNILLNHNTYAAEENVPRKFLAIYYSGHSETPDLADTRVHKKLELIFNYYGQTIDYLDVNSAEFKNNIFDLKWRKKHLSQYRGLLSWFRTPLPHEFSSSTLEIFNYFSEERKKLLIFGYWPFHMTDTKKTNDFFKKIGIVYPEVSYTNPLLLTPIKSSYFKNMEFERKLEKEIVQCDLVQNLKKERQIWLKIKNDLAGKTSDVAIVSDDLIYIQEGIGLFENPTNLKTQWRIDPFKMVEVFLSYDKFLFPIPDVSTLNGKRIWINHIDGDGINNRSMDYRNQSAGEIIYENILKKFTIPQSVSVIESDISPQIAGKENSVQVAKKIFALNHVEPASHTYSHPLSWKITPRIEEVINYLGQDGLKKWQTKNIKQILSFQPENYTLNYEREIVGSLKYINENLLTNSKKSSLLFWSGSCQPPQDALTLIEKNHILNINGGDSRFDSFYPSLSHLAPLARNLRPLLQIYAPNSNENIYTNMWTGPFNGQKMVIETFNNTETPRRLKPVNIYYHFYSGDYRISVETLRDLYLWAQNQNLNPIFVSDYIKMVQGLYKLKIVKRDGYTFDLEDYGNLRTIRLNTQNSPDYKNSMNVIGHYFFQNQLYVFLGSNQKTRIVLHTNNKKSNDTFISMANGFVDQFKVSEKNIEIIGTFYVPGEIEYWDKGEKFTTKIQTIGPFHKIIERRR